LRTIFLIPEVWLSAERRQLKASVHVGLAVVWLSLAGGGGVGSVAAAVSVATGVITAVGTA
jgi:hypothetical protein